MSDLIPYEVIIERVKDDIDFIAEQAYERGKRDILEQLQTTPTDHVLCKDCKHYYFADNRIPQEQRYSCDLDGDRWKPDDFCSYAERRTDEPQHETIHSTHHSAADAEQVP